MLCEQLPEKTPNLLKELIYCTPVSINPICTVISLKWQEKKKKKNKTASWIKTPQYVTTKQNEDLVYK